MEPLKRKFQYFILLTLVILTSCSTPVDSISANDVQTINDIEGNSKVESIALLDNELLKTELSKSKIALIYFRKGNLLSKLQKDQEAINNYSQALVLFETLKSQEYVARTYLQMGSTYAFLSEKVIATDYLLKALELNKTINDHELEANIYSSLAHIHYLYKDFDQSIYYTLSAIEIHKNSRDSLGLSATYNNIAVIYKNILQFEKAIIYNKKSLKLNQLLHNQGAIAKSYNNIGQVYEKTENYPKAILFYNNAIKLNDSLQNVNTSPIRNLANLYLTRKESIKAKKLFLLAVKIESNSSKINIQNNIYDKLLEIALQNKNFENSLVFQRKRDSLSNLQANRKNNENLKSLEFQYQLVNKKNELQKEKQQNRTSKVIFGIVMILLVVFTLLLIQFYKNKTLKNEKDKMQLEQRILRSQMNPHFIFNALSAIQNSLLDNDAIKSASYLSRFAELIRQNFDFINKKTILLKDELDALQNYLETQQLRFKDKFDYTINIHSNIDIHSIEIPPLLLQPFIENSIEHGFKNIQKKGTITITITKENNAICYQIKDNGKGFTDNKKDPNTHALDIFRKRLHLIGNNDEKTFSIRASKTGTTVSFCLKQ